MSNNCNSQLPHFRLIVLLRLDVFLVYSFVLTPSPSLPPTPVNPCKYIQLHILNVTLEKGNTEYIQMATSILLYMHTLYTNLPCQQLPYPFARISKIMGKCYQWFVPNYFRNEIHFSLREVLSNAALDLVGLGLTTVFNIISVTYTGGQVFLVVSTSTKPVFVTN